MNIKKSVFVLSFLAALLAVFVVFGLNTAAATVRPADFGLLEGTVVTAYGDIDVFIINDWGYKRLFVNPEIFNLYGHLGVNRVKSISPQTRDAFITSGLFRNCETSDDKVYALEVINEDVAVLHHVWLTGEQAVAQDPEFFRKVFCINNREFGLYPRSAEVYTSLSQVPNYSRSATPTPTYTPTPTQTPTSSGYLYYVSKSGSNSNDGSEARPWLTIQKAADSVTIPGSTVFIKAGTYNESVMVRNSGLNTRNITFTNFANDIVNVVAASCHGFDVEADYITIAGLKISDAYYSGGTGCFDWTASGITTHRSYNIFENNEIYNSMYGIMIRANIADDQEGVIWPTEGSNIVRNNYIHDTNYAAVRVKRSNNNVLENNRFHRNHLQLGSFNDKNGNLIFYTEAPIVFYCLSGLSIVGNEIVEPRYGPAILELDMVTRTTSAPSMAPNSNSTQCPLTLNNVTIQNNTVRKTENTAYRIILAMGRDFALGSNNVMNNNVWYNGVPGSDMIEWGWNFWHDNNADDGIYASTYTLTEFRQNTGKDLNSRDTP